MKVDHTYEKPLRVTACKVLIEALCNDILNMTEGLKDEPTEYKLTYEIRRKANQISTLTRTLY